PEQPTEPSVPEKPVEPNKPTEPEKPVPVVPEKPVVPQQPEQPTAFSPELASRRAEFKVEELVEFLYSAADNDQVLFQQLVNG
ncbi:hypothetical protein QP192_26730, partial [Escherichia coli]|nr:hypothetical protein [Escherichia coli]